MAPDQNRIESPPDKKPSDPLKWIAAFVILYGCAFVCLISLVFYAMMGVLSRLPDSNSRPIRVRLSEREENHIMELLQDHPECILAEDAGEAEMGEKYCVIGYVSRVKDHSGGGISIHFRGREPACLSMEVIYGEKYQWVRPGDCIIANGTIIVYEEGQQMLPVDSIEACPN